MKNANTKSALIVILILTFFLWLLAVPSGSGIGNTLAGLIMLVTIAAYWTADGSMKLFKRKPKGQPQFSAFMICHACKQTIPFKVNQYDHITPQAIYCDRCGKMNMVPIPALDVKTKSPIYLMKPVSRPM